MSPETSDGSRPSGCPSRFDRAISLFDEANAADPSLEDADGQPYPRALVYARRMTEGLDRFAPDAAEPLRLAASCQHIRRWVIPRERFAPGREGYYAWRTTLADFHAETAGRILRDVGYDDATVTRVQTLLRKERLKVDPDVQTLEDVICLVFFEHYLAAFTAQHDAATLANILRRTWRKMSDRGREAALGLDIAPHLKTIVLKAVDQPEGDRRQETE